MSGYSVENVVFKAQMIASDIRCEFQKVQNRSFEVMQDSICLWGKVQHLVLPIHMCHRSKFNNEADKITSNEIKINIF